MIVVSNTSPINYLVRTESVYVLPSLFERIVIPEAVHREFRNPAPAAPFNGGRDPRDI
jgi:predicted nucleic acid-binding protein